MKKPIGAQEFDGYPMIPPDKNNLPLSEKEKEQIGKDLRESVRKVAQVKIASLDQSFENKRKII